jgi:hypothetical protein
MQGASDRCRRTTAAEGWLRQAVTGSQLVFSALAAGDWEPAGRALAAVTSLMNVGDRCGVDSLLCYCPDVSVTATDAARVSHIATDGRSVSQSVFVSSPHLGLMTRYFFFFESYCPVYMGRPL